MRHMSSKNIALTSLLAVIAFISGILVFFSIWTDSDNVLVLVNDSDEMQHVSLAIRGKEILSTAIAPKAALQLETGDVPEGSLDATINGHAYKVDCYICPGINQKSILVLNESGTIPEFFDAVREE